MHKKRYHNFFRMTRQRKETRSLLVQDRLSEGAESSALVLSWRHISHVARGQKGGGSGDGEGDGGGTSP